VTSWGGGGGGGVVVRAVPACGVEVRWRTYYRRATGMEVPARSEDMEGGRGVWE
jgi:hypothetical protein